MMRWIARRIIAGFVGLLTIVSVMVWTFVVAEWFSDFAKRYLGREVPISYANAPRPDSYDRSAHMYYFLLVGALIIAVGLLAAILVMEPRPTFRKRAWFYVGFLLIVMPASWYNYNQLDNVLAPTYQVGLNLITIFLTATIAIWLSNAPAASIDVRVVKMMCVFFLGLAGFVPLFFSLLWLLQKVHLLSLDQAKSITWGHLTGIGAVASAIIAALNYRRELRKGAEASPQPTVKLIVPS
jgi:UDP-N-acetylmuramyl pentapeptide phosphotransferase/UDP-N-acetylglucosamine-1-phosphate transferase